MIKLLKSLYRVWMKIAHFIGRVNSTILLTIFYVVVLGLGKLAVALSGKDPLDSRWRDRTSYWRKRENFKVDRNKFLRPY